MSPQSAKGDFCGGNGTTLEGGSVSSQPSTTGNMITETLAVSLHRSNDIPDPSPNELMHVEQFNKKDIRKEENEVLRHRW